MITLRNAHINDLDMLKYWDEQEHVVFADPNDDSNWEYELTRTPEWREQLIAELDGRPIGFIQIIDPKLEETQYWGDIEAHKRAIDIWIGEEKDLGKGYGEHMMRLALLKCFDKTNVTEVLIDPLATNVRAIKFYKRLGFQFVENRRFGQDDCEVYSISREDWERIYIL